jgi:hypothetical protein
MPIGPHSRAWNNSSPQGSDPASDLDIFIQYFKQDVQQRADEEHTWNSSTTLDGQHLEGSARVGVGTESQQPPNNAATPQVGRASGATGGNEAGRLYRTTTGSTRPGRLLVSSNDDGTVVWNDAVKRVYAAAASTALTIDTGDIDFVSGAQVRRGGANPFDLHAHATRHADMSSGLSGYALDYLSLLPKAITLPTLTDQNAGTLNGSNISLYSFPWTTTGRRTDNAAIIIATAAWTGGASVNTTTSAWLSTTLDSSSRISSLWRGHSGAGIADAGPVVIAYVTGVGATTTTYYFNATTTGTALSYALSECYAFIIDLGPSS